MRLDRFLRATTVVVFVLGLILVWTNDMIDWRWLFSDLFAGGGLFAASFLVRPPVRR